ncbi:hypothetical protein B0O79_3181 [Flavobacteriaceae bacterium MAR_2009_75]|nr:hypothetical protein B0O79_3181 [Flavobacteriaceae bacterium MAR_2009_75]
MKKRHIKIIITIIGVLLATTHLIFPKINIDLITVFLIAIAIVPWVESLFKSVELPGGLKLEFQDLERIELEAKEAGLIKDDSEEDSQIEYLDKDYVFVDLAKTNPSLALVSLRIEIEKRLRQIAEKYSIESNRYSMSRTLQILSKKGILTAQENSTMRDMISTLNHAAHGMEFDQRTAEWIIDNGPQIIDSLDSKIHIRGGAFSHQNPESTKHWIDLSYEHQDWSTNTEWSEHIGKHKDLWEKEVQNLSDSIIKKLQDDTEKIEKFNVSHQNWLKQQELEKDFLISISDLRAKIGREGQMIMASIFMNKYKERALELEEILSLLE